MKKIRILCIMMILLISTLKSQQVFDLTTGLGPIGNIDPSWSCQIPSGHGNPPLISTNFIQQGNYSGPTHPPMLHYVQNSCGNYISPFLNVNNHLKNIAQIGSYIFTYNFLLDSSCQFDSAILNIPFIAVDDEVDAIEINGNSIAPLPNINSSISSSINIEVKAFLKNGNNKITVKVKNHRDYIALQICGKLKVYGGCCIAPCFNMQDTICLGASIVPDLSCMDQNISSYRWVIHELNPLAPWTPVCSTGYISGTVQNIDFNALCPGVFQPGKSYGISIDVFKDCYGTTINKTIHRNVYIAPKPEPFVSLAYFLDCETECIDIGFDLNTTLPGFPAADGAPFTAQWDDGSTNMIRTVCPNEPTHYYVTYTNRWGCESQQSFFVNKDTCCLDPCFDLPDTVCEGESIFPDLSCMKQNMTSYRWVIHELNPPAPWTPVCSTAYISGTVQPVDFNALCPGVLQAGKSYGISIDVFKDCDGVTISKTIHRNVHIKQKNSHIVHYNLHFSFNSPILDLNNLPLGVQNCSGNILSMANLTDGFMYSPIPMNLNVKDGDVIEIIYDNCCELTIVVFDAPQIVINPNSEGKFGSKNQVKITSELKVYPNPSNGTSITLSLDKGNEPSVVKIFDVSGKVISQTNWINSNTYFIDASKWKKGIYFVTVESDGIELQTKKLIIQ